MRRTACASDARPNNVISVRPPSSRCANLFSAIVQNARTRTVRARSLAIGETHTHITSRTFRAPHGRPSTIAAATGNRFTHTYVRTIHRILYIHTHHTDTAVRELRATVADREQKPFQVAGRKWNRINENQAAVTFFFSEYMANITTYKYRKHHHVNH